MKLTYTSIAKPAFLKKKKKSTLDKRQEQLFEQKLSRNLFAKLTRFFTFYTYFSFFLFLPSKDDRRTLNYALLNMKIQQCTRLKKKKNSKHGDKKII